MLGGIELRPSVQLVVERNNGPHTAYDINVSPPAAASGPAESYSARWEVGGDALEQPSLHAGTQQVREPLQEADNAWFKDDWGEQRQYALNAWRLYQQAYRTPWACCCWAAARSARMLFS